LFKNVVDITTTTQQTNASDDHSEWDVPIWSKGLSSISGNVIVDYNSDVVKNNLGGNDKGIAGTKLLIYGKDIFGNVWGPDKDIYPAEYDMFMTGLGLGFTHIDAYPSGYIKVNPSTKPAMMFSPKPAKTVDGE
jgi:hypothetical protein